MSPALAIYRVQRTMLPQGDMPCSNCTGIPAPAYTSMPTMSFGRIHVSISSADSAHLPTIDVDHRRITTQPTREFEFAPRL